MNHRFIDIAGLRFGRLLVRRLSETRDPWGQALWICYCDCGKEKIIAGKRLRKGETKSCGCLQREIASKRTGPAHPSWRGGISTTKDGYRAFSSGPHRGRLEHDVIMEMILGRPLFESETVHHKNGVRADNRDDNLELWASNHAKGQRVEDLKDWAVQLLRTYAPGLLAPPSTVQAEADKFPLT